MMRCVQSKSVVPKMQRRPAAYFKRQDAASTVFG